MPPTATATSPTTPAPASPQSPAPSPVSPRRTTSAPDTRLPKAFLSTTSRPSPSSSATRAAKQRDATIRTLPSAPFSRSSPRRRTSAPSSPLATGSGKTLIAVLLLRKIADAGQLHRALFVCDRDELRSQGLTALQNAFGSDAAEVSSGNPQKNARILIGTYQTLNVAGEDEDAKFLTDNYPEDYFSHIIIDECHRSAWGRWSNVLTRNPNAFQIGLTATPREIIGGNLGEREEDEKISANNLKHFGEPVYEYDISQGIEDGYLAACEVIRRVVDVDQTGITRDDIQQRTLALTDARTGER